MIAEECSFCSAFLCCRIGAVQMPLCICGSSSQQSGCMHNHAEQRCRRDSEENNCQQWGQGRAGEGTGPGAKHPKYRYVPEPYIPEGSWMRGLEERVSSIAESDLSSTLPSLSVRDRGVKPGPACTCQCTCVLQHLAPPCVFVTKMAPLMRGRILHYAKHTAVTSHHSSTHSIRHGFKARFQYALNISFLRTQQPVPWVLSNAVCTSVPGMICCCKCVSLLMEGCYVGTNMGNFEAHTPEALPVHLLM